VSSLRETIGDQVRGAAFRRLLSTGKEADVAELAVDLGRPLEGIAAAVDDMNRQGRLRLDGEGRVFGAAGLSVASDRHEIDIDGRRFWTWCAYDIMGIFGALGASGLARSASALSGRPLEVRFRLGRPEPANVVLFRPDETSMSCCENVYEKWCPNSNFFETREAARTWSKEHGLDGRVLTLDEASDLATRDWEPLVSGIGVGGANHAE
jgi:alkylmercury lyase